MNLHVDIEAESETFVASSYDETLSMSVEKIPGGHEIGLLIMWGDRPRVDLSAFLPDDGKPSGRFHVQGDGREGFSVTWGDGKCGGGTTLEDEVPQEPAG